MTTIYVNHSLGIVLTDTRTTTSTEFKLFGITFDTRETYNDNGCKAIHVHDRIFVESGSCQESTKILQYLIHGTKVVPAPKRNKLNSSCFLIDKNWMLHLKIHRGKFTKEFHALSNSAWYCTGSGSDALMEAMEEFDDKPSFEQAINAFKTVHLSDNYTNDKVRIYYI